MNNIKLNLIKNYAGINRMICMQRENNAWINSNKSKRREKES